jgi:hypothetical protein
MRGPADEGRGTRDERTRGLRTEVRDRWLEKLNVRRSDGEKIYKGREDDRTDDGRWARGVGKEFRGLRTEVLDRKIFVC